jgi:hypothetical protein
VKPAFFHILNSLWLADSNTLRVTATEVAFVHQAKIRIKSHCARWACRDTHLAANAQCLINDYAVELWVAINRILGACGHAERVNALLAGSREMKRSMVVSTTEDLDAGSSPPFLAPMLHGTGYFALFAARAFKWVDGKRLNTEHFDHLAFLFKCWVFVSSDNRADSRTAPWHQNPKLWAQNTFYKMNETTKK